VNAVYPWLESAWFQPLNLSLSEQLGSKYAYKFNLCYYNKGSPVYEETHLDALTPPGQPRTLSDLCNDQLPMRGVLDKLSTPGDGGGGDGFAPPPPACPLPRLHTLRVVNAWLVHEPTAYGDLVPLNIRLMVQLLNADP
jgi:hypothetical protein